MRFISTSFYYLSRLVWTYYYHDVRLIPTLYFYYVAFFLRGSWFFSNRNHLISIDVIVDQLGGLKICCWEIIGHILP